MYIQSSTGKTAAFVVCWWIWDGGALVHKKNELRLLTRRVLNECQSPLCSLSFFTVQLGSIKVLTIYCSKTANPSFVLPQLLKQYGGRPLPDAGLYQAGDVTFRLRFVTDPDAFPVPEMASTFLILDYLDATPEDAQLFLDRLLPLVKSHHTNLLAVPVRSRTNRRMIVRPDLLELFKTDIVYRVDREKIFLPYKDDIPVFIQRAEGSHWYDELESVLSNEW